MEVGSRRTYRFGLQGRILEMSKGVNHSNWTRRGHEISREVTDWERLPKLLFSIFLFIRDRRETTKWQLQEAKKLIDAGSARRPAERQQRRQRQRKRRQRRGEWQM